MSNALSILGEISATTGLSEPEVLKNAGLSETVHYHWRNGTDARASSVRKLRKYAREATQHNASISKLKKYAQQQQERPEVAVHADMMLTGILIGTAIGIIIGVTAF